MTDRDRQRILVVEDDPEFQHLLSATLDATDRDVIVAGTATEARQAMAAGDLDLVVLDLILPDADGRTLLTELREDRATAGLPVVVLSARAGSDTRLECRTLGADVFVEKPFDPGELAADVALRLEQWAAAERAELVDSATGVLNRAGLEDFLEGDGREYGLGFVRIDDFAERAERLGWEEAEAIAKQVADALRAEIPEEIALGRLGGGDFAVIAPGADLEVTRVLSAEIVEIVRRVRPDDSHDEGAAVTATVGAVLGRPAEPLGDTLEAAREIIFRARSGEGDCVVPNNPTPTFDAGHVLVAEDDEMSATILLHRLHKEGLEVRHFDNGQDAYRSALDDVPMLVILDVKMPGLDGFEVLEGLRQEHRLSLVPVIMLTSMGREADVVRAFRMGADDYILKPFSPAELSARVRRLLTKGRSPSAI